VTHSTTIVLGAGPAGLAAAAAASATGESVLLIDDNPQAGGQIWRGGPGAWHDERANRLWRTLSARANVTVLYETRVVDAEGPSCLLRESPTGAQYASSEHLILCTGARELLLPFPGWTLPGVTGAGGLQALIKGGMAVAGKKVVVAGSGPLLLAVAKTVQDNGGEVVAIAERRSARELAGFGFRLGLGHRAKLGQTAELLAALSRVPYLHGATVTEAQGAVNVTGDAQLKSVALSHRGGTQQLDCDFLACGYGLVPNLELARLLGLDIARGRVVADYWQRTSIPGVWAAGETTGFGGVDKALAEGHIAGMHASGQFCSEDDMQSRAKAQRFAALLEKYFAPDAGLRDLLRPDTIVCRCEDVRAEQLEAHAGWRAAKLMTRCGMGPCQGRVCGAACEFLHGWQLAGARQPVFPAAASTLAMAAGAEPAQQVESVKE
jgi:NADPH-dependent 2,4-dienoyl-CoA reductase/sulfur reductase-like enzyme